MNILFGIGVLMVVAVMRRPPDRTFLSGGRG
jgi:hypothetical protein